MFPVLLRRGKITPASALRAVALSAVLGLGLFCAPGLAQNAVKGPAEIPPPPQKPVPMKMLEEGAGSPGAESVHKSKFPNIDTAKNRRDYEMGTDAGQHSITLGRDEESGDTVMIHKPPKQVQPKTSFEEQPIQVRPIVPTGPYGR
ncbi:hypothetical protein [Humidesulfovibrio idahonensis]